MNTNNTKIYSQYPWLNYDENCDVLVIGGGLTGSFCLNRLANEGVNAIMLSQKPIGFSSSCAYSISQYGNELMITDICKKHSKETAISYFKQCEQALNNIEQLCQKFDDVYFKRRDSVIFANSKENVDLLHSEYLMRRHNGIEVEFLEKSTSRDQFSFELEGGILAKNQAAELDDYALCHGLIKESESLGCRIFENTTATEIKVVDDSYQVITAYGKKINAKKIILCLGKSVSDYIDCDAEVKTSFTLVTKQLDSFDGYSSRAIVKDIDRNITMHTTEDDSLIITGLDCSLMKNDSRIGKIIGISKVIDRKYLELEKILSGMLIGINSIDVIYKYTGEYLKTNDLLPIVTSLSSFNDIYLTTPSSINGVIFSYITANKIATEI